MSNDSILPRVSFSGWCTALNGTASQVGTMNQISEVSRNAIPKLLVVVLSLAVALSTPAYDYPLTSTAIRDAYFLGRREAGLGTGFLAEDRRAIPSLGEEEFVSFAAIETNLVQVAVNSRRKLSDSAPMPAWALIAPPQ